MLPELRSGGGEPNDWDGLDDPYQWFNDQAPQKPETQFAPTPAGYGSPAGYGPPADYGPGYGYGGPAAGSNPSAVRSGGAMLPVLLGIAILSLILVLLLGGYILFQGDDDSTTTAQVQPTQADTAQAVTETATATVPQAPAPDAPPASSSSPGRYVAGAGEYGVGLNTWKFCDSGGASATITGSKETSCPFAENVGSILAGTTVREGSSRRVTAYSPVTRENVTLSCRKAQDSKLTFLWKCVGGRNAVVYVYP